MKKVVIITSIILISLLIMCICLRYKINAELIGSSEEAVEIAIKYLDENRPELQVRGNDRYNVVAGYNSFDKYWQVFVFDLVKEPSDNTLTILISENGDSIYIPRTFSQ